SSGGIVVDPAKVDVVSQWGTPESVSELRSFLGLAVDSEGSSICLG
ncbi:retrotransposon protein putative Ty3-gypsy subclass, partial [Trifolium medium]|nr:retrotransposon protein putative Ty3-gypsy subclass [Trifolium medium]